MDRLHQVLSMTKHFAFSDKCIMFSVRFAIPRGKNVLKFEHGRKESDSTCTASHHALCKHNVTISSLVTSLGTSSGGLTLFQRLQRIGARNVLFTKAENFASRHTAWYFSPLAFWKWLKAWDVNYPCRHHTEPYLDLKKEWLKMNVNYHHYMICMVAKPHS